MNIGITISIGRVQGSGGGSSEPSSEINYYANDGSTLLLTIPLAPTFTGTLYNQPIDFGG